MPPKKETATKRGKKAKQGPEAPNAEDGSPSNQETPLTAESQVKDKKKGGKHDELPPTAKVHGDFDCMLNQTNISQNNNKFYVIQVLEHGNSYYSWNRWGRVGGKGRNKLDSFNTAEEAIEDFEKKFLDKTKNNWSDRENFEPHPEKYTLIEMEQNAEVKRVDKTTFESVKNIQLDEATKNLIRRKFGNDKLEEATECINSAVPLGKLSERQINKGVKVLDEIEKALNQKAGRNCLEELSSKFFTTIPHNFGRKTPPIINNKEILQEKRNVLEALRHIEVAPAGVEEDGSST